jgi:hypothetical protein
MMRLALMLAVAGGLGYAPAAAADEADAIAVADYCHGEAGASDQLCQCLLRQFAKLTPGQQALVGAMARDDAAEIAAASAMLDGSELAGAEGFLKTETLLCRPSG